jgi:adenylate kinase
LDHALSASALALDAVLLIEVPDELIVERITGRRMDPQTGAIYHLRFSPPPAEIASRLQQRPDDTEKACRARLAKYHSETAPIIPFYEAKGLLRRIDGVGDPSAITPRAFAALGLM